LRLSPKLGFVDTSNAAMAAVRSEISFVVRVAPPFEEDPAPLGRVDLLVFDRTFGNISEIVGPFADGGGFGDGVGLGEGPRDEDGVPFCDGARVAAVCFREDM
jgi:hypothetical protein